MKTLIVLGKNFQYDRKRRAYAPSVSTRMLCAAATVLNEKERFDYIILSGGDTVGSGMSEARSMKGVLQKEHHLFLAEENLLLEERSLDTFENACFSFELLRKRGLLHGECLLLTTKPHRKRAGRMFSRYMGTFVSVAGEDVLRGEKRYKPILREYTPSLFAFLDRCREPFAWLVFLADRNGGFGKKVSHFFRGSAGVLYR